jgi:DNA-binding SARP family transcriptional activator
VEFKLLGPVKACTPGDERDLLQFHGLQPRHRLLLAALLLAEGQRVGMDRLIEQMWGGSPPATPHGSLHHYASKLRAALRAAEPADGDPLPSVANGYRIRVEPDQVDVLRFRDLTRQARLLAGHDDMEAMSRYRMALREWGREPSGVRAREPLAGLPGPWAENCRTMLRGEYRDVLIECLDAGLRLGRERPVECGG